MVLLSKRRVLSVAILFFVIITISECKRGGGRRGGTYRGGSSNVWGRAKQQGQNGNYDMYGTGQRRSKQGEGTPDGSKKVDLPVAASKASAPPAPSNQKTPAGSSSATFIQQEKKQQVVPQNQPAVPQNQPANAQKPIGWDVNQPAKTEGNINKNVGWNVGNSNPAHASGVSNPVSNTQNGYPNTGASSYYGTGSSYNYGNSHNQAPPPYSPNSNMGNNNYHNQAPPPYSPTNTGNYGNGYQQQYNHNQPPPPYSGNYGPNYNQPPPAYSPGAYGNHYGGGNGGGGFFGGNKYGNSGYGGYGGMGGYGGWGGGQGVGGYGKKFGGGFGSGFGKHAVRNVIVGLLVWNLVSGITRRPYNVYNYYNNPEQVPQEISLPANLIVLCNENVTSLCAPNTAPLCTSNDTILCVVLAQQTVPCGGNSTLQCVNSTVTCTDGTEDACEDSEKRNSTSFVNIPCVTNATIIGKMLVDNTTTQYNPGDTTNFCVTTLALPQPEEETNPGVQPLCNNGTVSCANNSTDLALSKDLTFNTTTPNIISSTVPPQAM